MAKRTKDANQLWLEGDKQFVAGMSIGAVGLLGTAVDFYSVLFTAPKLYLAQGIGFWASLATMYSGLGLTLLGEINKGRADRRRSFK